MRIAINTRLLIAGKMDGIGWFTAETLRRIVKSHPDDEFFFLFDREPSAEFIYGKNVTPIVLQPPARHPILWYMFFEWSVAKALKNIKADIFVSTDGFVSLHSNVPTLAVIHDLNFEHASGNLKASHQLFMSHYFPRYAHHATRIATVSEYSKKDIAETYSIDNDKIGVVYNGAHNNYRPLDNEEKNATRQKYSCGKPYFIFVSTIHKRKNLTGLLKAFDKYKTRDSQETQLIVVGAKQWWGKELKKAYETMQFQKDVHLIGRAEPEELSKLMAASIALVYPSYFEGFGIPIVEAFEAETAVITSNTTSMPEVAGNAAILVDPNSEESICDAMLIIANNESIRQELIDKGRERKKLFNWDKTAEQLWGEIEKTISISQKDNG